MTRSEAYTDLFILFTGEEPPFTIPEVERLGLLSDAQYERLQEFAVNWSRLPWLTGIGILEAMDSLVDEAIANSEEAFNRARPGLVPNGNAPKRKKR